MLILMAMGMMVRKHAVLGTRLSAVLENGRLPGHVAELANDLLVPTQKRKHGVRNVDVGAELLDETLGLAQVVPRHPREQVVHGLELEPAMEEVEPLGAVDVHGRAQHLLGERLVDAQVGGRHGVVGEGDLDVERGGDHVRDEDEEHAARPGGDVCVDDAVAEPRPEKDLAHHLEPAVPPGRAVLGATTKDEVLPAEEVEVEATEQKNRVVRVVLPLDGEPGHGVKGHDAVVVGAVNAVEELRGQGEERHQLDVGVVLGRVCDDVVHVVAAFPPAQTQASDEVCDDYSNGGVDLVVVRDGVVAGVVGGEDQLVPEAAQEDGGDAKVGVVQEEKEEAEEHGIAERLDRVRRVVAVIKPLGTDALAKFTVLCGNVVLVLRVHRRVQRLVQHDLLLRAAVDDGKPHLSLGRESRRDTRSGSGTGPAPEPGLSLDRVKDGRRRTRALLAGYLAGRVGLGGICVRVRVRAIKIRSEAAALDGGEEVDPSAFDAADLEGAHALAGVFRMQTKQYEVSSCP